MFASVIRRLRRFIRDESGPTAVEYAVMLTLIIIAATSSVRLLGESTNRTFRSAARAIDQKTDGNQNGKGQD
jgi:pilus assembly protein Flp/PilA